MTFLQPFILWGLPLILVPVLIHLINRLRHRRQQWAAMRFLLSATRSSISHAKLRQFLVLFFRVMAVLALILFLSRPLAGGWLGWALSPAPDAIILLLDRSASMETKLPGSQVTRREQALRLLTETARGFQQSSHVVLIDSASRTPQEVANVASLSGLPASAATDTAADFPALIQTAVQWLIENRAGTAELWIASDLQQSNWQPGDSRWTTVTSQLAALPQKVRVRLLTFGTSNELNTGVALREVVRRQRGDEGELNFTVDFQRQSAAKESLPVTLTVDGVTAQNDLAIDGPGLRWRHKAGLGGRKTGGWGSILIPQDGNVRDNAAYFVYGTETPMRAEVVSADAGSARYFQLAAQALARGTNDSVRIIKAEDSSSLGAGDVTLMLWQGALPDAAPAEKIRSFVEEGGAVMFFPPGTPDGQRFNGVGWGEVQGVAAEAGFRVARWDEDQGPLARTDEGISLPLNLVTFQRRQGLVAPNGGLAVMAAFEDGAPFLARQTIGRGEIYFCASQPRAEWSSLGQGAVLVPMIQRLWQTGTRRLQNATSISCGELSAADRGRQWVAVDGNVPKDIRVQAGVYRSGDRFMAVNRPGVEDELEVMDAAQAKKLFGDLPFQMLEERRATTDALQGEIWRVLLFGMMAFLLGEGILMLPPRAVQMQSRMPV